MDVTWWLTGREWMSKVQNDELFRMSRKPSLSIATGTAHEN